MLSPLLLGSLLAAAPARADQLDAVREAGVLRWGSDAAGGAPYVYKDPHSLNSYIGFEAELAAIVAKSLGVRAERVQTEWDKLIPGLQRGDFDVALNGMEMTSQRQNEVLFSSAYYASTLDVAVLQGETMTPTLASLRGKRAGALKETFAERLLREAGGIQVNAYEDLVAAYLDLKNRRVDAVVTDSPVSLYYGRSPKIRAAPTDFGEARYGVAMRRGELRFAKAINAALQGGVKSGELKSIYERYGVWNQPTAELFDVPYESPQREAPMVAEFHRKTATLRDKLRIYREATGNLAFGSLMTLSLSVASMALAIALGLCLVLARLYGPAWLGGLAAVYVEGVRGTPLLIQLYLLFYALPDLGVNLPPAAAAVLGLGLNYAAYEAENYRAGLAAIPLGQTEAAHSLGLTQAQTLRWVLVPQALRIVIPPVTNDFIALLKDSSIVSVIAMVELTETYGELASATGDRIGLGLIAAVLYFLLGWPFARLAARLEEKAREGRRLAV